MLQGLSGYSGNRQKVKYQKNTVCSQIADRISIKEPPHIQIIIPALEIVEAGLLTIFYVFFHVIASLFCKLTNIYII